MRFQAIFTAASLVMAAYAQDKLNCGAEVRIYDGIDCTGNLLEAWTLNNNDHIVKTHQVYGSPDAPVALSVGWDKAAHSYLCLGIAEQTCERELGAENLAYDSQCHSLEPGCETDDCWEPFGRLYISNFVCSAERGYEDCGFSANW